MSRWGRYAAAYLALASIAVGVGWGWLGLPMLTLAEPWLALNSPHAWSAACGLGIGLLVVALTRISVGRFAWAKQLHRDLRPFARGLTGAGVLALATFSALGEELLFRGVVQPLAGVWLQALIFGVVHYVPGPSRWVWVGWAASLGLMLGLVLQVTGSLAGPLIAHAVINGVNLRYLKLHDPDRRPRDLGGLLSQRS